MCWLRLCGVGTRAERTVWMQIVDSNTCIHTVRSARFPTPHNRSQHIQANTRSGFIQFVLLTMDIMMLETCWVSLLWINIYTCVICWFFLLLCCWCFFLFWKDINLVNYCLNLKEISCCTVKNCMLFACNIFPITKFRSVALLAMMRRQIRAIGIWSKSYVHL